MNKIILFLAFLISVTGLMAQNPSVAPLARGEKQINFGAGIYQKGIPTFFSVDFALHKDVTLTPEVHAVFPFPEEKFKGGIMVKADYHWNYLIGIPANWIFMQVHGQDLVLEEIFIRTLVYSLAEGGIGAISGE